MQPSSGAGRITSDTESLDWLLSQGVALPDVARIAVTALALAVGATPDEVASLGPWLRGRVVPGGHRDLAQEIKAEVNRMRGQ